MHILKLDKAKDSNKWERVTVCCRDSDSQRKEMKAGDYCSVHCSSPSMFKSNAKALKQEFSELAKAIYTPRGSFLSASEP